MKYIVLIVFVLALLFVGFVPAQSDFALILAGFAAAYGAYFLLVEKSSLTTRHLLIVAIGIRVVFIFVFPNLSDDIYRFIWDGQLLHLGQNPFEFLPSAYIDQSTNPIFQEIYPLLNSPNYYSVYPPFAQLIFYISTFEWMNSAVVIKVLLLIAELTTIFFGMKLLKLMNLPERNILWYALNPLIIIEIMVNIHFEGFMLCFFVLFLYALKANYLNRAALFISLSISAKLLPLLFLPFFLCQWVLKKSFVFYLKVAAILLLLFTPLLMQVGGFGDSLDLYFRKFEFNASIYYLLRSLGNVWKGYNMISSIGPWMAICVFGGVFVLAYTQKDIFKFSMWSLLIFLLLSTTVHPWYLALGILLCVFTQRKFFIVWSFLIVLSYAKYSLGEAAYYWLVAFEYSTLFIYLLIENRYLKNKKNSIIREGV